MFLLKKRFLITAFKLDCKFLSKVHKAKKRIITLDQKLINDESDFDTEIKLRENIHKRRKGISFMDNFDGKSIERVSDEDERFSNALINARSVTNEDNNLMVIEGVNMVRDAIKMNGSLVTLFFTLRELLKEIPFTGLATNSKVYYVTYEHMKKFSNLTTPPGIIGIFKRPNPESLLTDIALCNKLPLTLILDKVTDPGTVGTIIRTAAGFNVHKILMTNGCADLYSDRVLRASMSSLLSVPVFEKLSWPVVEESLTRDCTVYGVDGAKTQDSYSYDDARLIDFGRGGRKMYGLVVGDPVQGLSMEARQLCARRFGCLLSVPMDGGAGELRGGLLAAIVMAHFQKKFLMSP